MAYVINQTQKGLFELEREKQIEKKPKRCMGTCWLYLHERETLICKEETLYLC